MDFGVKIDHLKKWEPFLTLRHKVLLTNTLRTYVSGLLLVLGLLCSPSIYGQELSTLRSRTILLDTLEFQLDTLIVIPASLMINSRKDTLDAGVYDLGVDGVLRVDSAYKGDTLELSYRVLDIPYYLEIANKDTAIIRSQFEYEDPFAYAPGVKGTRPVFGLDGFEKRGSISRGIQVGNAQDLSVNSELDLQLSGKFTDRISILANISDDNIPIQADGSTQQLQEFDQVYIKIYDEQHGLTAGDYQISSGTGYFSQYLKKARGALYEFQQAADPSSADKGVLALRAGAAVSRGRFARNVIQGVEGNQGPYKLRGAENELFVIILSGTERVFVDGRQLKRGQEYDYVIDYNAAEITFTAKQLITKDRRIVVEFQYAEQNYARSLLQLGADYKKERWHAYIQAYSEQDAKNQGLQQELEDADKLLLSRVGDDLDNAFSNTLDSVAFSEDQVLYALTDSLGFDSIFVFSTDPESARFNVEFTRVGQGNGDYIQDEFSSNGRVFRWVAPLIVDGVLISQGNYTPGRLLITPKSQQLVSGGLRHEWNEDTWMDVEVALSNMDLNRFSSLDSDDDLEQAFRWRGSTKIPLDSVSFLRVGGLVEHTGADFQRIERYRAVEFERNWNVTEADLDRDQLQTRLDLAYERGKNKRIQLGADRLTIGSRYEGFSQDLGIRWEDGPMKLIFQGSSLTTSGPTETRFQRHISGVSYGLGPVRLGFRDDREDNTFRLGEDSLTSASYRWYEWETYITTNDTSEWSYRVFFKNRDDWRPDVDRQLRAAHAEEYGMSISSARSRNHLLDITGAWRTLEILREELIAQEPEETFLGRMEYRGRFLNGVVDLGTFYEIGSGLERRREFIYLEVPAGQGVYVWVDYDGDGVRDLDEFEIAQFEYEANFIRVYTPTDSFEKVFSNQVSQTLLLDPGRAWRSKTGWKRFIARFSDQAAWRAERKTREEEGAEAFNPFVQDLNDTILLSLNNSLRNSVFFNKTDPVWSIDHRYSDVKNKQLLTNGSESRASQENSLNFRYTIQRKYTLRLSLLSGRRSREASYSVARNYQIDELSLQPSIEWQPDRTLRLTLSGELSERDNQIGDGERSNIQRLGAEARLSQLDKGSINATLDYVLIDFDGDQNSSLAFEMLDGLRSGNNFTWSLFLQRNLSKNLALNITYNGRRSEENPIVHSGGVQVRAFF